MPDPTRLPLDPRAFRDALGRYATGVTVVTTTTETGPLAMTANSFASVSMDPPLVLWSPAKSSARHDAFANAAHFSIHILAEDQQLLAGRFARDGRDFPDGILETSPGPTPRITGCAARFDCSQFAVYPGGDHSVVLGHVDHFATTPAAPLVFLGGRYGCFA